MTNFDPLRIYGIILPLFLIFGYYLGRHVVLKSLLEHFRICIDRVDDALKDNTVSEEELMNIWDACYKEFIDYLPSPPKKSSCATTKMTAISIIMATARENYPIIGQPKLHMFKPTIDSLKTQSFKDFEFIIVDALYKKRLRLFQGDPFNSNKLPFE